MTGISSDRIYAEAERALPFQALPQQEEVLRDMCAFAADDAPRDVFVLNGYAGTGKTSLVGD